VLAINGDGVAVGTMPDRAGRSIAYRWSGGSATPLELPSGASQASAEGINAASTIVGYVTFCTGSEPAIWENDRVAPLAGAWGVFSGIAWGITPGAKWSSTGTTTPPTRGAGSCG
jgi:uncharacterized membrane protein